MTSTISRYNPFSYIKSDWNTSETKWGKLAVIVFYSFMWFQIINGTIGIFIKHNPTTTILDDVDVDDHNPNTAPTADSSSTSTSSTGSIMNNNQSSSCHFSNLGPYGRLLATTYLRQVNLFLVAFILYAYPYGIKVSNIAFVLIIMAVHIYLEYDGGLRPNDVETLIEQYDDGPKFCDKEYIENSIKYMNIITIVWPLIALGLSIIEYDFAGVSTNNNNGGGRSRRKRTNNKRGDRGGGGSITMIETSSSSRPKRYSDNKADYRQENNEMLVDNYHDDDEDEETSPLALLDENGEDGDFI